MSAPTAPFLSVVIPVFRAECLPALYQRLVKAVGTVSDDFEIVMVNDASPDQAWEAITSLSRSDARVRGIDLELNVGQHVAILAGLDHARGQWVVVTDCDLQDRPEEIPRLYQEAARGFDIVLARRAVRRHPALRRLGSKAFYAVLGLVTGIRQDPAVANFGIYRRSAVEAMLAIRERYYFPLIVRSVPFRATSIDVEHGASESGQSSYNLAKMLKLAVTTIRANWRGPHAALASTSAARTSYRVRETSGSSRRLTDAK